MFGLGIGRLGAIARAINSAFSPSSLFSGGAPGVWYDPSDYSTLFQDSAGTTPVTAVEQPVGLMLDKSQGLVLGPELVTNGDFSNGTTGWAGNNATPSVSGGALVATPISSNGTVYQAISTTIGRSYVITVTLVTNGGVPLLSWGVNAVFAGGGQLNLTSYSNGSAVRFQFTAQGSVTYVGFGTNPVYGTSSYDNISVKELPGNHAFQSTSASRPVLSARVNKLLATATLATQSVTTRATAHTLRFEGAGTVTLTGTASGVYTAGTHSITTTAGTLTLTVVGSVTSADLRETNDGVGLPVYQAVVTSTNYATTGFLPFLRFDGVDDGMLTNSISFTSTDKMSVFAGVRKLSDAARGMLFELSATSASNNGSFGMTAPNAASATYAFESKGTVLTDSVGTPFASPLTSVLSGLAGISTDSNILRVNGVQADSDTGDQGAGNYGTYPLYIGRRGGTSLSFKGQLYSMTIVGKQVTATELSSTETYTAIKTGVTLA